MGCLRTTHLGFPNKVANDKKIPVQEQQLSRVTAVAESLSAVTELHNRSMSSSMGDENDDVLFQTWPVDRFYTTAREIVDVYTKELGVKKCLVEEVAQQTDSKTLSFFVTAWGYQAYVDDSSRLSLEALVHEVGFK